MKIKPNKSLKSALWTFPSALDFARQYPFSQINGFKNRKHFKDVETYCMTIGCSRSGKSLICSLLDAHSEIIIADELNTIHYIYGRFKRNQIYYLILKNSKAAAKKGRVSKGNSFKVPNQWQGRFKELKIIGDNSGVAVVDQLRSSLRLLHRLRKTIKENVKFLRIIRNPYDNISSIFLDRKDLKLDLKESLDYYFGLIDAADNFKKDTKATDIFELSYETFVENPKKNLSELCSFLGVEASDEYLDDCASIVYKSPHKRRFDVKWTPELIESVEAKIDRYPFLKGYAYEG